MSNRSGMAALAIVAFAVTAPRAADPAPAVSSTVYLELQITGVGPDGCTVEIKPAHPACQFKTVTKTIEPQQVREVIRLDSIPIAARATGVDRDCSFAITVKEPNLPPKTSRRGIVLTTPSADRPSSVQVLKVYLNSPAIAAKDEKAKTRR